MRTDEERNEEKRGRSGDGCHEEQEVIAGAAQGDRIGSSESALGGQKRGSEMTRGEHIERHKYLHAALDELVADFLQHTNFDRLPSVTPISDLMAWSCSQTHEPASLETALQWSDDTGPDSRAH